MKKTYYIVHGLGASADDNWFPWLKQELENRGEKVIVPNFPNSFNPNLDDWINTLRREIVEHGEGILIGHSLGGVLVIKYIEAGGLPKKVILVGTPFGITRDSPEISNFFERPIKFSSDIKNQIKFSVLYSDNDPLVQISNAKSWGELLNIKPILVPDKEHFLQTQFPEILNYI